VPVGAKGGFVVKQPSADPTDREAVFAEVIDCYTTFIRGLLDITDNRVAGQIEPPPDVVRHDGNDPYLVVAADKGTATFSDIANSVADEYGFWLGDAFASGGSSGYDHKAMGITARGAWVSVQRHFREMGVDCQREDITVVGIGDMSGDVFGNGMLLSEHIRLVAAFDHRHIFLDPSPDAAASFKERQRLFELPRSSWADYDAALISPGGGVYPRDAKSVPVTPEAREALGIDGDVDAMTPHELMHAILLAPVDLLWNGGIGTYVKASTETNADVGDKANDSIRVDGNQLRCKAVGEGGNLGLSQLGRVEYALAGGRINTDAIDNSAGVDTSDHEVNIKILLDRIVDNGDLTVKQRNSLLAEMTDEVAALVLRDNYGQNIAIACGLWQAPSLVEVHARYLRFLERRGYLNRSLEFLPTDRQLSERRVQGRGLTAPEFAVMLSYTKIAMKRELLASDLPEDQYLQTELEAYFPGPLREQFAAQIAAHPLRREIITTCVVNNVVNNAGTTFAFRLSDETGASTDELARAHTVGRVVFDMQALWEGIEALNNKVDSSIQTRMRLVGRTIIERASRWLVNNRRPPIDIAKTIEQFRMGVSEVVASMPNLLVGLDLEQFEARRDMLVDHGVPEDLAIRVSSMPPAFAALSIVETATSRARSVEEVARLHFYLGEVLRLGLLLERIIALPRNDRWQTMARAALRDDLHSAHAALTAEVLESGPDGATPEQRLSEWRERSASVIGRAEATLDEVADSDTSDLAMLSVALRAIRTLVGSRTRS
jgi:glutamate dehydrogenase